MQVIVRVPIEVAERASQTATILLLSDDTEWRATVERVLGQEGYRVVSVRHTGQALVESIRLNASIDLLLTDGDQGQRRSDFPRIFKDHPRAALLHLRARPHTRDELLGAVESSLNDREPTQSV